MAAFRTHYQNLKVERGAPKRVISAAYKALSLEYHPDRNPGNPEAEKIFKIIQNSYDVLSDPVEREKHDEWIARQEEGVFEESYESALEPEETDSPTAKEVLSGLLVVCIFIGSIIIAHLIARSGSGWDYWFALIVASLITFGFGSYLLQILLLIFDWKNEKHKVDFVLQIIIPTLVFVGITPYLFYDELSLFTDTTALDEEQSSQLLDCISIFSIARDRVNLTDRALYNRLIEAENQLNPESLTNYFSEREIDQRREFHLSQAAGNNVLYLMTQLRECGFELNELSLTSTD